MKSLSRAIVKTSAKTASNSAWLLLVTVVHGASTVRLVDNPEDVVFAGNTYTAASITIGTAQESSDGQMTSWSLVVDDVSRLVAPMLEAFDGAVGATVTLVVVNSKLLAESYTELTRTFTIRATTVEGNRISIMLCGGNLLVNRWPRYRYISLHCMWKIGSAECGIPAGACNRTYANCVSNANQARFGGFLALRQGSLRYV
jgi:phage-related protein